MMSDIAISLVGVSKTYRIYNKPADRLKQSLRRGKQYFREHQALLPLSLEVKRGHTVGVIGCNGSGKSTLLQIIAGTLNASSGDVKVNGRISALLELGAGFNPAFSGRDNINLSGSIMGLSKAEIAAKYDEIIAFSGLKPEAISQAVSTYSSGMYVRLAFATAIAVNPEILIVDEALAVGDEGFQRKCFARIRELQEKGATIFFVSHSGRAIIDLCDHAILLDAGELLMQGAPANVVASYHNMLFAPESEKANIRAQIKSQQSNAPVENAAPKHTKSDAPETQIIYPEDGGKINKWGAFDEAKNPALIWEIGKEYQLEYELEITKPTSNLRCSMMIKTITGIELAGALWRTEQAQYQAGDKLKICFNIPCKFTKGDYFINIGAVEEQFGTYRFLHRIVDALHIKVVEGANENANIQPTGLIDAGINSNCLHFY